MGSEQNIDQHSELLYSIYCKCAVMSSRFHPDLLSRIELGKSEDILGEFNPGFSLWTSAHGFSHFRLSESKNWRRFWGVVIILAIIGLLSTFIFYSYQTFSSAVYSQIEIEPLGGFWPRAIFCDRQGLSRKAVEAARLSPGLISYLTWSFHPSLVEPSVLDNTKINMENVKGELGDIIEFNKE